MGVNGVKKTNKQTQEPHLLSRKPKAASGPNVAHSSHTCTAANRYPSPNKCPELGGGGNVSSSLLSLAQVSSKMRAAKGCSGLVGFRESMALCQEGRRGGRGEIQSPWAKTWNFPDFPG